MNNQLQINPPDGYEIDQDKSDLLKGVVHFKKTEEVLSYKDVATGLLYKKSGYYIDSSGNITNLTNIQMSVFDSNMSPSKSQLESILALNKLCNVAKYLNGDWLPSTKDNGQMIYISGKNISFRNKAMNSGMVSFKTKELAQQAIEILGEEEIRKALTLNH